MSRVRTRVDFGDQGRCPVVDECLIPSVLLPIPVDSLQAFECAHAHLLWREAHDRSEPLVSLPYRAVLALAVSDRQQPYRGERCSGVCARNSVEGSEPAKVLLDKVEDQQEGRKKEPRSQGGHERGC